MSWFGHFPMLLGNNQTSVQFYLLQSLKSVLLFVTCNSHRLDVYDSNSQNKFRSNDLPLGLPRLHISVFFPQKSLSLSLSSSLSIYFSLTLSLTLFLYVLDCVCVCVQFRSSWCTLHRLPMQACYYLCFCSSGNHHCYMRISCSAQKRFCTNQQKV